MLIRFAFWLDITKAVSLSSADFCRIPLLTTNEITSLERFMKRIQLFGAILLVAVPLTFLAAQTSSTGSTKKASTKKAASAEDKAKRPSPPAQATLKENGETVATIDYSSPRAKGRKIMGELVPYGKEWRTGANE